MRIIIIMLAILMAGCNEKDKEIVEVERIVEVEVEVEVEVIVEVDRVEVVPTYTKIAFFGNSITNHSPGPDVGWSGDWGMAASMEELDYSNQVSRMLGVDEFDKFRGYFLETNLEDNYDYSRHQDMMDYEPDLIILNIGENTPTEKTAEQIYRDTQGFYVWIRAQSDAHIILVNDYYGNGNANEGFYNFCVDYDVPLVNVGEMRRVYPFTAAEFFENTGVGSHPSDKGMLEIANRIMRVINPHHVFETL